jgi:hypothetical protein
MCKMLINMLYEYLYTFTVCFLFLAMIIGIFRSKLIVETALNGYVSAKKPK